MKNELIIFLTREGSDKNRMTQFYHNFITKLETREENLEY